MDPFGLGAAGAALRVTRTPPRPFGIALPTSGMN